MVYHLRYSMAATAAAVGALFIPVDGQALEGNQCKIVWSIAALHIVPVKERLSQAFKISVKEALIVFKDGQPLELPDGSPVFRPCNDIEKRQFLFEKLDDAAAFETTEKGCQRQGIYLDKNINLVASPNADRSTLSWLAERKRRLQQRVP